MEKNRKRIFFISLILVIAVIWIVYLTIFKENNVKNVKIKVGDIESIEVNTSDDYFRQYFNYKINFKNKSIIHKTQVNDKTETSYTSFTDENVEYFIENANLYGFFEWEGSYNNQNVDDGLSVKIVIKFQDGFVRETHCYEDFPPNYDKMAEVFYKAFGYSML